MFDNYGYNARQSPTTAPATPEKKLYFDKGYLKTKAGILKLVELACNFLGFICIKASWSAWVSAIFYNILYWVGNIVTLFLLLSYLFHVVEKRDSWPWLKLEFFFCCIMSLAYIVMSIFAATIGESIGYAVGFFGLCAIIAYGFDGFLKYRLWRRGLPAQ